MLFAWGLPYNSEQGKLYNYIHLHEVMSTQHIVQICIIRPEAWLVPDARLLHISETSFNIAAPRRP